MGFGEPGHDSDAQAECKRCLSPTAPLMPHHPPKGHFPFISDQGKLRNQPEEKPESRGVSWTPQDAQLKAHSVHTSLRGQVQREGLAFISNELLFLPLPRLLPQHQHHLPYLLYVVL